MTVQITDETDYIQIVIDSETYKYPKNSLNIRPLPGNGDGIVIEFYGSTRHIFNDVATTVTVPSNSGQEDLISQLDFFFELDGGGTTSPLTTKGDTYVFGTTNDRLPVGADGQTYIADSTQPLGVKWGTPAGGSGATESGTSIRVGTGSSVNSTKNAVFGINSTGGGINATAFGAACHAGQSSLVLGNDNFASGATVNNCVVLSTGATNVKVAQQNAIVIAPGAFTMANGHGGIYIGRDINVTSVSPANTTTNNGVYIGRLVTHTGAATAGAVIIGYNNNGRNGIYPVLIGHSITTADGLQNSIVMGYQASAIDGQPLAVVIGPGAKAYLDGTHGTTGGHQVAIGYNTFAGAWRATAVGGHAQALAVSSTATGYGSYCSGDHGSVNGRGGYNDLDNTTLLYTGATGSSTISNIYLGGVSGTWTNPAMPGSENVDMSTALNAGTVISKLFGVSGRDARPVPSLTNVRGGHTRVSGGQSTGTGLGGELQWATSPAGGASNNTINSEVVMLTLKADYTFNFTEAVNIVLGTTTGTKIGTATTQKIGFWNATPIVQPTTGVTAASFTANAGTAVNDASTFDGYTIGKVVKALRNLGILA